MTTPQVKIFAKNSASFNQILFPSLIFTVDRLGWNAIGGPSQANVSVTGSPNELWSLLDHLRDIVRVYNENSECVWWGFIESVEVEYNRIKFTNTIEKMANKVKGTYTKILSAGETGATETIIWVEDAESQSEYGVRDTIVNIGESSQSVAQNRVDLILASRHIPMTKITVNPSMVKQPRAVLVCKGFWSMVDWVHYELDAGYEGYEDESDKSIGFGARTVRTKVAQSFQIASAVTWSAKVISIKICKSGSPSDNIIVKLCSDSTGSPGTSLASSTIAATAIDENVNWLNFELDSRVALTASTIYWITVERSGSLSKNNMYRVEINEACGYASGSFKIYNGSSWAARSPDCDMVFKVSGETETTQQIVDALSTGNPGQFVDNVVVEDPSGIYSCPFQDGNSTTLEFIEKLMNYGTTNKRRILAKTSDILNTTITLYEEPDITDYAHILRSDGRLYDFNNNPISTLKYPVGVWVILMDIAPEISNLTTMFGKKLVFIEEVFWYKGDRVSFREKDPTTLLEII